MTDIVTVSRSPRMPELSSDKFRHLAEGVSHRLPDAEAGGEPVQLAFDHALGLDLSEPTALTILGHPKKNVSFAFSEHGPVPTATRWEQYTHKMVNNSLRRGMMEAGHA